MSCERNYGKMENQIIQEVLIPSGAARCIFTSPCASKDEEILHNERP